MARMSSVSKTPRFISKNHAIMDHYHFCYIFDHHDRTQRADVSEPSFLLAKQKNHSAVVPSADKDTRRDRALFSHNGHLSDPNSGQPNAQEHPIACLLMYVYDSRANNHVHRPTKRPVGLDDLRDWRCKVVVSWHAFLAKV